MVPARPDPSPFEACATCGSDFEVDVNYPVVVRENGDGELELYSFCDECCEAAWRAEH